jgi:arginyl-tRNA synthetase
MATTHDTLSQATQALKLDSDLKPVDDSFPGCYPLYNPLDAYRVHLSNVLAKVSGVDAKKIYPSLHRTQTLDRGDLMLAVPALGVKGKKPQELAAEWAAAVSGMFL